jgi:hypothetical protein
VAEGGDGGRAGDAGASGSGEGGGAGGQGGDPDCGNCDDLDPCTTDGCEVVDGEPTCQHQAVVGLALDGIDETYVADDHVRVTMVGGPDAFYFSDFGEFDGERDLLLFRLGADEGESELATSFAAFELTGAGQPVSAAGLAVDDSIGLRVHAFVGSENTVMPGARAWHLILQGEALTPLQPLPVGDDYATHIPTNYPVAINIDGAIYGAWITAAQSIELSGVSAINPVLATGLQPTTLTLMATSDDRPAVLYTGTGSGAYVETADASFPVNECQANDGAYFSSTATWIGLPGAYVGSWTKAADEFLTHESKLVLCGPGECVSDATCEGGNSDIVARNIVATSAKLPGDPAGVVHYAQATPFLTQGAEPDSVDAGLLLQLLRIDFGDDPLVDETSTTEIGPALQIARAASDDTHAGPDWPAIAYVAPDKVAVAWLQPGADGDELRVQRYQMCLE